MQMRKLGKSTLEVSALGVTGANSMSSIHYRTLFQLVLALSMVKATGMSSP